MGVEAQIGGRWGEATVRRVRGAKLTVQFSGAVDVVDVSRTHVRAMAGQESKTNEGLTISPTQTTAKPLSPESRSRCSGGTPPPPHPSGSRDVTRTTGTRAFKTGSH